jgi:PIN domain nuclease of toxin-antitoxin system
MESNRYLLDTHTLIWFQEDNPKIPIEVLSIIENPDNIILFSQISLFEIAIKQKIGKLPNFAATIKEIYDQAVNDTFTFVGIQNAHIYGYAGVELIDHHRDPFDRLLISTAIEENAIILSNDDKLKFYNTQVKIFW